MFIDGRSELSEFDGEVADSIGFFDTVVGHAANRRCTVNKQCDRSKCLNGIADIRHVNVDTVRGGSGDGDAVFLHRYLATHALQAIDEFNITLKRIGTESVHGCAAATNSGRGPKVTGGGGVRFDRERGTAIVLIGCHFKSRECIIDMGRDTKSFHHFASHFDIGTRNKRTIEFDNNLFFRKR